MKRSYVIVGFVVVLLVVAGAMFVPSYLARQGLGKLAVSLPPGAKLTYASSSYSLFSQSLVLKSVVLHLEDPAIELDADEVRIKDGNSSLDGAIRKAQESPGTDDGTETRLADRIVVTGLHTLYGPLDVHMGSLVLDRPRLFLTSLLSPLPQLQAADAATGAAISPMSPLGAINDDIPLRQLLQRAARAALALSFDRMELEDTDLVATDHVSGQTVNGHIGKTMLDGMDRGHIKGGAIENLSIGAQDVRVTAAGIHGDIGDQRPFLSDLRAGLPPSTAFSHYPGISETISDLALQRGSEILGIVEETAVKNVTYGDGIPTSMDLSMKGLKIDPAILPTASSRAVFMALQYDPAVLDVSTSYTLDLATQQATIKDTALILRDGGVLTVDAVLTDIGPNLPRLGIKISSATVRYEDKSLFTRWIDYVAKATGKSADSIKSGYIAVLDAQKPGFKNDKPLSQALDAAEKFVANPLGITVTMQPQAPVGLADFDPHHPGGFTTKLGLKVTAEGAQPAFTPVRPH